MRNGKRNVSDPYGTMAPIIGNAGINVLAGGQGNDTYTVQTTGDTVVENADEGVDSIESSVDFTLGENLSFLSVIFLQPGRYALRLPIPKMQSLISGGESGRGRHGDRRGVQPAGNDAVFEMRRKA